MTSDLLENFIDDVLFEENGPPASRLHVVQELITQYTNMAMSAATDVPELNISMRAHACTSFTPISRTHAH